MNSAQLRQIALMVGLGIGVTVGGVAAGALILAPAVATATQPDSESAIGTSLTHAIDAGFLAIESVRDQTNKVTARALRDMPAPVRRLALPVLFGTLALAGFAATGVSLFRRRPQINLPSAAGIGTVNSMLGRTRPVGSPRPARAASRTPKAVQALADSGTEPSEIAWRTGLSLDAVAMLISIGGPSRQLRPPTA